MAWSVGDRVRHAAKPEWGLGEVVEIRGDETLLIYFEHTGEKRLKGAPLTEATGPEAQRPVFVRRTGTRKARSTRRSIQHYKDAFVEEFPQGFSDPAFVHKERDYKVEASQLLVRSLAKKDFNSLISASQHDEACRLALMIINKTNLIFPNEKMDVRDGLRTVEAPQRFADALFELLYGAGEFHDRFTGFGGVLADMGTAKWTVSTYFPFLALPKAHMFLKPVPTKRIAEACNIELNYRPEPNWLTYQSLLRLADRLAEDLVDLAPRDMIDLQSFIWCVAR